MLTMVASTPNSAAGLAILRERLGISRRYPALRPADARSGRPTW